MFVQEDSREALVRVASCQQFCNFYGQDVKIMDITLTLTYQHHSAGQVPLFSVVGTPEERTGDEGEPRQGLYSCFLEN